MWDKVLQDGMKEKITRHFFFYHFEFWEFVSYLTTLAVYGCKSVHINVVESEFGLYSRLLHNINIVGQR